MIFSLHNKIFNMIGFTFQAGAIFNQLILYENYDLCKHLTTLATNNNKKFAKNSRNSIVYWKYESQPHF